LQNPRKKKVLWIDAHPDAPGVHILENCGYEVTCISGAGAGARARAALAQAALVDAAVIVIGAPVGLQAASEVAYALRAYSALPLLFAVAGGGPLGLPELIAETGAGLISQAAAPIFWETTLEAILSQAELKHTEALFRSVYEQSPIGIELYDARGQLIEVNRACLDLFGVIDSAEISHFQLFDDPNLPTEFKTSLRTGLPVRYRTPFDFERVKALRLYHTTRSGSAWIDVFVSPLKDEQGQVTSYLVQVQDISARKSMEDQLKRESRHYALLMQTSRDAIYVLDREGHLTDWNQAFLEHLGYTTQEAARLTVLDWNAQWDKVEILQRIADMIAQPATLETRHRRKDGAIVDVEITAAGFEMDGQPHLYISARDITERKRSLAAQRASEARFRFLFEQAHDAVFIMDLDGHYLSVNQRAADMLGYTVAELTNLTVYDITAEFDHSQNIMQRLANGEHIPLFERRLRKKDGQVFPVEINVELVRDPDGSPLHIQSMVRDISQRKEWEAALTAANEQLQIRLVEIEKLQADLREQALRDSLTGLYNRRYLDDALAREIARAARENETLSVIISDIDLFKGINDTYGHPVGDIFLVQIAQLMRQHTRGSDIVCRYGGEEFVMVLPGTALEAAQKRAEEIRQRCLEMRVTHAGKDLRVSLSFGLAVYPTHGHAVEELLIKADIALYQSKNRGRNCVTVWNGDTLSAP
jgi:diguanylate cyclase (GGDEF)-like protein/PAS domain S-box-containing protein